MDTVKDKRVGVLCYVAGVLFPIIFLTSEPYKSDHFVRFHSWQSIAFSLFFVVANLLLSTASSLSRFAVVWQLAFIIVWITLMIQAYRGRLFGLPVIGSFAQRLAG